MKFEYDGIYYATYEEMLEARRRQYVQLVISGMNYSQAAREVGVSKRTGEVWRNGRTRKTGRNEPPCKEWLDALAKGLVE